MVDMLVVVGWTFRMVIMADEDEIIVMSTLRTQAFKP